MIAASIYARKSADERADADAKSVAHQIDNARAFAAAKGWTVADAHVYSDDGISGAEIRKLVNRQRLLDAVNGGRPPFQVLIMRDSSRLSRRDGDEAFGELKRIAQAGVQIWFYGDGSCFSYGTLADNVVFVRAEMNAEYRRSIAKWTHEAFLKKAKLGHIVGACYGFHNFRVNGLTERRIDAAQASVIRHIYAEFAAGAGCTRIAKALNRDEVCAPPGRNVARARGGVPRTSARSCAARFIAAS